jgi:hypothetical protein
VLLLLRHQDNLLLCCLQKCVLEACKAVRKRLRQNEACALTQVVTPAVSTMGAFYYTFSVLKTFFILESFFPNRVSRSQTILLPKTAENKCQPRQPDNQQQHVWQRPSTIMMLSTAIMLEIWKV